MIQKIEKKKFFTHSQTTCCEMMSDENETYNDTIKKKDECTINGYIRIIENESFMNHSFYMNIPRIINYLCMKFYHESKDRFHPHLHGSTYELQRAQSTVNQQMMQHILPNQLLSNIVRKGYHEWRFMIHKAINISCYRLFGCLEPQN